MSQEHERPSGARPVRRHPVARQVLRHEVEQARQRRRPREPQRCRSSPGRTRSPNGSPMSRWARNASARPSARPPRANSSGGIMWSSRGRCRSAFTLMMNAAVPSSFCVLAMRDWRISSGVLPSPRTSGMTATPVSKPERPSASFGNMTSDITTIISGCLAERTGCASSPRRPPGAATAAPAPTR